MFAHIYEYLISNVQIVRTFENRIPIQTFENWHNVISRYISCVKSETSDIWRTDPWFLKPFGERVEENRIYNLVKPNSTVKTRTVYIEGVTCVIKFFWKMEKLTLRVKFETLT